MPDLDSAAARWVRAARTNIRRRMARSPIAFAMSGGGSQGSFETGVLRFLYDDLKLRPAILCGSSVGSIIAAKLAEGDDEATGRRAIDETEDIWRGLRSNDDMWLAEPWLEKLRSQANWASELRGRAAEHGTAGSQARVVLRMLSEVVRHPPETDGTLEALRQAMRARSLLSMQPVRELVETQIDPERIAASGIVLRIGAVGLESGELRYFTETGEVHSRDGDPLDQPAVPVTEAVLASASIPLVFPPTRLNDEHYVDGGVREILPLELAFNRLGAGHIFAVVASTPGVERVPDVGDKGLLELARRVTADIVPDETLRKEISPPRGWGRRVTVIAPELDVHDALTVDRTLIAASIDYGYMRAADVLLSLGPEQAAISARIAALRMEIRALDGPIAGPFTPLPELPPPAPDVIERQLKQAHAELDALVDQRREAGAPLPPGDCAPVKVST
ncbi:MAG: patatin-like phospholipase family protein [Acidimicrobiia bacterium]